MGVWSTAGSDPGRLLVQGFWDSPRNSLAGCGMGAVRQRNEFQQHAAVSYSMIIGVGIRGRRTLLWEVLQSSSATFLLSHFSHHRDRVWEPQTGKRCYVCTASLRMHQTSTPLAISALTHREEIWGFNTFQNKAPKLQRHTLSSEKAIQHMYIVKLPPTILHLLSCFNPCRLACQFLLEEPSYGPSFPDNPIWKPSTSCSLLSLLCTAKGLLLCWFLPFWLFGKMSYKRSSDAQ